MTKAAQSKSSLSELGTYVGVPAWVSAANWELITLPEQGASDLPGRTDYVVLVAFLRADTPQSQPATIELPALPTTAAVPPEFARTWLPRDASATLKRVSLGAVKLYDARSWVKRPSKRSLAVSVEGGVLLYVEYISP
jgi:hypothetical protein